MSHRIAQFLHSPQCAVNQRRISATELFFAFGNVAFPDARSKSKGTNQKGQGQDSLSADPLLIS